MVKWSIRVNFCKRCLSEVWWCFQNTHNKTLLQFVKNAYAKPVAGAEKKKEGDEKEDTADQLEAVDLKIKIK